MPSKEKKHKDKTLRLYCTHSGRGIISLYKKPSSTGIDNQDAEVDSLIREEQSYALAKYRELVANRRAKESSRIKEPEVFHHHFYKKV